MASSGTFTSTHRSYIHLDLDWKILEQQIGNNRSKVQLTFKLRVTGNGINFSAPKNAVLQGSSFKYTGGFSGTGTKTLRTRDIWVSHNNDGKKTQNFNASINIAINFSGSNLGNISVSGDATLDSIAQASTLTAFGFPNSLQIGNANSINYTVDRKNSGFRHQLQLKDGNTTVRQWDNLNTNGANSVSLSAANVDNLLGRMPNGTTKSFTLRLATRNGNDGSFVGNVNTRTASATVHSNIAPEIFSTYAEIVGNTWAINQGIYVQGQTGVEAEFSSNASGGANVRSRNIKISNTNGGSIVDGMFQHTINTLNNSGNTTITYEIEDTRGRKTTSTKTINVLAYSPPKINDLTANRLDSNNTTVEIYRAGTTSTLGNRNSSTLVVEYQPMNGGDWTNVEDIPFTGNFDNTSQATGVSISSSFIFRVTVKDDLGNSSTSQETVGTAQVLVSYVRDEGVGVGKIRERGVLDVGGEAFFSDVLHADGGFSSYLIPENSNLDDFRSNGFYYNPSNAEANTMQNAPFNQAFSLFVEQHAGTKQTFTTYGGSSGNYQVGIWTRNQYSGGWGEWMKIDGPETGSNDNGRWWRFPGEYGLQICTGAFSHNFESTVHFHDNLPANFVNTNYSVFLSADTNHWRDIEQSSTVGTGANGNGQIQFTRFNSNVMSKGSYTLAFRWFAIGRWK